VVVPIVDVTTPPARGKLVDVETSIRFVCVEKDG